MHTIPTPGVGAVLSSRYIQEASSNIFPVGLLLMAEIPPLATSLNFELSIAFPWVLF